MLEYKGYDGDVELEAEAGLFHGEVVGTRDVVSGHERRGDRAESDSHLKVRDAFVGADRV